MVGLSSAAIFAIAPVGQASPQAVHPGKHAPTCGTRWGVKSPSSRPAPTRGNRPPVGHTARHVPHPIHRATRSCSATAPGGRSGPRPRRGRTSSPAAQPTASEPNNPRRESPVRQPASGLWPASIERLVKPNATACSTQAASHRRQPMQWVGEVSVGAFPIGQTAAHAPHWVHEPVVCLRYGARRATSDKAAPSGQTARHHRRGASNASPAAAATSAQQMAAPRNSCGAPRATCTARELIAKGSSQPPKLAPAAAAPSNVRRTQNLALETCCGKLIPGRRPRTQRTPSMAVPSGHTQPQNTGPKIAVTMTNPRAIHP